MRVANQGDAERNSSALEEVRSGVGVEMQPVRELFGVGAVSLMLASSAPEAGTVVVRSSPRTAVVHPNRVVVRAPVVVGTPFVSP